MHFLLEVVYVPLDPRTSSFSVRLINSLTYLLLSELFCQTRVIEVIFSSSKKLLALTFGLFRSVLVFIL